MSVAAAGAGAADIDAIDGWRIHPRRKMFWPHQLLTTLDKRGR